MTRPSLLSIGLLVACGSDPDPPDLVGKLRALDGVTVMQAPTDAPGFSYYILSFEQPVDHDEPNGQTFHQRVSLMHRDEAAPMVALTTGYWDYYGDRLYELTGLLGANQISIEHRFFGDSRPDPADWSKLTIRQMADDEHEIITRLRTVYPGAFLTTGGSKGGMTATYHRRFYPDDVDGTVPYVAPISFAAGDTRYAQFLDTVGTEACRTSLRAAATEMLQNRRAGLLVKAQDQAAQDGHHYTRILLGPALESSVVSLEWSFWQYFGIAACAMVPPPGASDQELWDFLDQISPVTDNDDASIARFEAYYHQAYAQLGYPDAGAAYLDPYLVYSDHDYDAALPAGIPAYDGGAAMRDIDEFVQHQSSRMLFVYGQWDPWTAGHYALGQAEDSILLIQAMGTHGSRIGQLADGDRELAFGKLAAWTGVTAMVPSARRARTTRALPDEPRVPPAMVRARPR